MANAADRPMHSVWHIPAARARTGAATGPLAAPTPLRSLVLGVGVALAVLAPWLVHLIPVTGAPLGPVLLPMFYAPMMAALVLRLPLAVLVSVAAPIVSRYLTGMPPDPIVPSLMLQIAGFVITIRVLRSLPWVLVVPVAYLVGLTFAGMVTQSLGLATVGVVDAVQTGWPGLVMLAALGFAAEWVSRGSRR